MPLTIHIKVLFMMADPICVIISDIIVVIFLLSLFYDHFGLPLNT